jgi:hypothetical protein
MATTTVANNTAADAELTCAVHSLSAALTELRTDPLGDPVRRCIELAGQALGALEPDLTTTVLGRLLDSVDECHRAGQTRSRRLAVRERSAVRALRMDPRWKPAPAPQRRAG